MYTLRQFTRLPAGLRIEELNRHGVALHLACSMGWAEAVLFAYNGFYVELVADTGSDEILALRSFKNLRRLEPYLEQVDISDVAVLLSFE